MKPFRHWSATQVSTFRLCNRKWYLNKIVGMDSEETQALTDGKRYAAECEVYMKTGSTAGLSPVTRPVAALGDRFPKPQHRNTLVEYPIGEDTRPDGEKTPGVHGTLLEVDGLPGVGFMDVCDIKEDRPIAWDFKSTKAKKWIKTQEELTRDVQMAGVYAPAVALIHRARYGKDPQLVGVAHVALLKPPEAAEAVVVGPVWLTPDQVESQWQGVKTSVRTMKEVALLPGPDKVTPTWSACGAFGGCPYKSTCQALKSMSPTSANQGVSMSLLSRLTSAPAAAAATPAAAPAPTGLAARIAANMAKPGQVNPPDAAKPTGSTAGIAAALKPATPAVQQVAAPARNPVVVAAEEATKAQRAPRNGDKRLAELGWDDYAISCMSIARKHEVLDGKLTPTVTEEPEEAARDWDLNSNEALEEGVKLGWTEDAMQLMSDEVFGRVLTESLKEADWTLNTEGTDLVTRIKVAEVAPVAARRVRAAKPAPVVVEPVQEDIEEVLAALEAPVTIAESDIVHAPAVEEAIVQQAAKLATATDNALYLYIGCRPTKGVVYTELAEHLVPAMREIEQLKKVTLWSQPPYNDGEKMLAASLLLNPVVGHIVVDPKASYASWCLDVLIPAASIVVRA